MIAMLTWIKVEIDCHPRREAQNTDKSYGDKIENRKLSMYGNPEYQQFLRG